MRFEDHLVETDLLDRALDPDDLAIDLDPGEFRDRCSDIAVADRSEEFAFVAGTRGNDNPGPGERLGISLRLATGSV